MTLKFRLKDDVAHTYRRNRFWLAVIIFAFIAIGIAMIFSTKAAGLFMAAEPEQGTITQPAVQVSDTTASAGKAVKFTPPSTGTCPAYPQFPDAACTGPTGTLTLWTGGDEFRTDGQVIQNVEIRTEGMYIPASNVTFRNCKIIYTGALEEGFTIMNLNNNSGTVIDHCELDCQSKVDRAISGSPVTVRYSEIHHCGNAIETESPLVVEENYIHDIRTPDGLDWHADGIQTPTGADNIRIVHNVVILTGPETGAINILGTEDSMPPPIDYSENVLIENNLFGGGGYTMYVGPGRNYRVVNNHFTTQVYPKVGGYNAWYPSYLDTVVRTGNVMHETGAPANENL